MLSQKEIKSNGLGTEINFKPNKNGIWKIEVDGKEIFSQEIKGWKWLSWIKDNVWISIAIFLGMIGLIWYIFFRDTPSSSDKMPLTIGGGG